MNSKKILFIVFGLIAAFFACKKDGETVRRTLKNKITLINAGGDTLNVYENGTRINNGSSLLPSGQYRKLDIIAGTQRYQFKKAGSSNTLFETELSLNDSTLYSVFVAGRSADQVFVLKDDTVNTENDVAYVKYVNASPDAGNIDFTISNQPTAKGIAFKSATPYVKVAPGQVFYSMYRQGQSTPLASGTITLTAGTSYNLFTKGLVSGTGTNALGARLLIAQ